MPGLLRTARALVRQGRRIVALAFAYNTLGIAAAATGYCIPCRGDPHARLEPQRYHPCCPRGPAIRFPPSASTNGDGRGKPLLRSIYRETTTTFSGR